MEHTQPSLIANIPHLQRELTASIGPSTYSNIAISGGTNHIGHYYAPQAPQPSPPAKEPPFTVPFSRDENFVPRDGVVEELIGKIRPDQHSRAALFGMGGVGKTQIAIELAFAYRDLYPDAAVFWLFAGTPDRLLESFGQIATDLELPGHRDPKTDVCSLVLSYLSDFRNGKWLLVVDNVNDYNILNVEARNSKSASLASLPQTSGSTILLTTRDRSIAIATAGDWSKPSAVEYMPADEAALLFENRVPDHTLRTTGQANLLTELDHLPLAIVQAAAYMTYYRVNTSTYLEYLRSGPGRVLGEEENGHSRVDSRRDRSQTTGVINTIQVSIERLAKERSIAASLLMVMSVFDGQCIPKYCLDRVAKRNISAQELLECLGILSNLSLIRNNRSSTDYSLHKLVRTATQHWVKQRHYDKYRGIAASMLLEVWPTGSSLADWTRERELYPHARKVLTDYDWAALPRLDKARLEARIGGYLKKTCHFLEAASMFREAYHYFRGHHQEHHDEMVNAGFGLSDALWIIDPMDAAAESVIRAVLASEERLGIPQPHRYLDFAVHFAVVTAQTSLSKNLGAERALRRALARCRNGDDGTDRFRAAVGAVYKHLSLVLLVRDRFDLVGGGDSHA